MDLMRFFKAKPKTSSVAKERLQLILAHERIGRNANGTAIPDFLPQLQKDTQRRRPPRRSQLTPMLHRTSGAIRPCRPVAKARESP